MASDVVLQFYSGLFPMQLMNSTLQIVDGITDWPEDVLESNASRLVFALLASFYSSDISAGVLHATDVFTLS